MIDEKVTEASRLITHYTAKLVSSNDRFYAEILFRLRRKMSYECPSMGVSLENGGTLLYNPDFVIANESALLKVLIHECIHLIDDHITRGAVHHLPHNFVNICADFAVNSLISDFPNSLTFFKGGASEQCQTITVPNFIERYPTLQSGKAFEWYVDFFKMQQPPPDSAGSSDDHSQWSKLPTEATQAALRKLVDDAVTATKQAGKEVPENVRDLVEQLLNSGVSWEQVLKNFPANIQTPRTEPDRMKRNRRYGLMYPGHRKVRETHIAVLFDVSGSISNDIVSKFDVCCNEIFNAGCKITVLFFDDKVYKEIEYMPGCFGDKIPGGGGTNFQPPIDKAVELGVDGIIFLTDGMNAEGANLERPPLPIVWGLLEGYKAPVEWGRSVEVK